MEGPLRRAKMILVSPIIELISGCISLNSSYLVVFLKEIESKN